VTPGERLLFFVRGYDAKVSRLRAQIDELLDGEREPDWRPMVRCGMFVPLWMQARASEGEWVYRDPTEEEIQDHLSSEA
jgi:hypothetical protein